MKSLNEIKIHACQLCGSTKLDVDVYKVGDSYEAKLSHLRRSKNYVLKVKYERGEIKVRDIKGKTIETIKTGKAKATPEKKVSPEKKEQSDSKDLQ